MNDGHPFFSNETTNVRMSGLGRNTIFSAPNLDGGLIFLFIFLYHT